MTQGAVIPWQMQGRRPGWRRAGISRAAVLWGIRKTSDARQAYPAFRHPSPLNRAQLSDKRIGNQEALSPQCFCEPCTSCTGPEP